MQALGLIEVYGYLSAVVALDSALKAADVHLVNVEKVKGGLVTVLITGDVGAVKAAIDTSAETAGRIGKLVAVHVIPRPDQAVGNICYPKKDTAIRGTQEKQLTDQEPVSEEQEVQKKPEEPKESEKSKESEEQMELEAAKEPEELKEPENSEEPEDSEEPVNSEEPEKSKELKMTMKKEEPKQLENPKETEEQKEPERLKDIEVPKESDKLKEPEESKNQEEQEKKPVKKSSDITIESMQSMTVDQLRNLARKLELPDMTRKEIKFANKKKLLQSLGKFLEQER